MGDRYSFSLTTFSPSGKLVQIEYALNAVAQGITSIGVKATNGIVIATERKTPSVLVDDVTLEKVAPICDTIGVVYSGMGPDARLLIAKARKSAQAYKRMYMEDPPVAILVQEIAAVMQEYTQSGGVRPFGVSLLVAGYDAHRGHSLYQVDPSGTYFGWKATAIGKQMVPAKTFLEKRFTEGLELDDAIHTAILTLKEGIEGQLDETSLEIGVVTFGAGPQTVTTTRTTGPPPPHGRGAAGTTTAPSESAPAHPTSSKGMSFRKLTPHQIRDYLENIA